MTDYERINETHNRKVDAIFDLYQGRKCDAGYFHLISEEYARYRAERETLPKIEYKRVYHRDAKGRITA